MSRLKATGIPTVDLPETTSKRKSEPDDDIGSWTEKGRGEETRVEGTGWWVSVSVETCGL